MSQRLTTQEIEDIKWYRMTFKKRPSVKKYGKKEPLLYLYPKGSFGEIAQVFGKPVSTVQDVLKK